VVCCTGVLAHLQFGPLTKVSYLPAIQKGVIGSIAGTRLTVSPALSRPGSGGGSPTPGRGQGGEQTNATIYGEVEIHFHTEV